MNTLIGLDIGGANLKASNGIDRTIEIPFSMWKDPSGLTLALRSLEPVLGDDPDIIAVTMTGELADCFRTKAEGVDRILTSVKKAFPRGDLRVWQTGAEFFTEDEAREFPILVAAANWHALATWAGRACPEGTALLIDIGSTTTDIIPISHGMPVSEGGTDPTRLLSGELVYTGVRRTPLCALAPQLEFRGQRIGVAAELFATTRDVHLWLGSLSEAPEDCDTANGRPATREFARDRLVRMLCADSEEVNEEETDDLARQWASLQRSQIREAVERVLARQDGPPRMVLLSGEGEFISRQVLLEIPTLAGAETLSLASVLGPEHSVGACAYAVSRLAAES
jgi:(4-(4-[2-(gamma-L-glutamylamino)ethyl]phenoxymethyl)furan-2-yl)methanamine synthase